MSVVRALTLLMLLTIAVAFVNVLSMRRAVVEHESSAWSRSDEVRPPMGVPFVGAWVDEGELVTEPELRYGEYYFEYASTLEPPVGGTLGTRPPVWWTVAPGGAE